MAGKKIAITKKPTAVQADEWVEERKPKPQEETKPAPKPATQQTQVEESPEELRRFTIDISEQLHRKIKAKAAMEGETMAKMLRRILEEQFT
ncbi:MAG: hypothetical protein KJ804_12280 [Proteobacteria bacterium]|nr:hypothetical protein [Pseudomonadota bacterium]